MKANSIFAVILTVLFLPASLSAQQWTQFRGDGGVSVSSEAVPTKFDDKTNIAWKLELPGRGASGAIVVGNQVIVTSSAGDDQDELFTSAYDSATGKHLWTQKFWATGRCLCHPTSANAAPTPTSDGTHIYAFYSSNDLACLDLEGSLVWYRGLAFDRPRAGNDVGMSSSPIVDDGIVVVQVEGQADSFVMGLDARNGETLWTKNREAKASWASPLLLKVKDQPTRVAIQSRGLLTVLDLKSGETVFETRGDVSTISSAAFADGKLYVPVDGTTAFEFNDKGKLEKSWSSSQIKPSSASGVVYDGKLLTLNRAGVMTSYDLQSGEELNKLRVGGSYWSTPVIAAGQMYFFAADGTARVVDLGKMEVIHEYKFEDEEFLGSPAISNGALFIRSANHLIKIANTDATQP